MFYRDALNGLYVFGGIYAAGVLGWAVTDVGLRHPGGDHRGDLCLARRAGRQPLWPQAGDPASVVLTALVCAWHRLCQREAVFGMPVGPDSRLPDIAFYVVGAMIGAAGGMLQSASRTMMVRQSPIPTA
jgi:MFS transporter, UMF1 family